MQRRRKLPSPSLVISVIALCVAIGGTAYAALGKNSVGSKQIKTGGVRSIDIADNAVTGGDIAEATLGVVPSASSAQQASTAQQAEHAAGADQLDGKDATCPAGTTLFQGACYENVARPAAANLFDAQTDCADEGRYLPDLMDVREFVIRPEITLGAPSEFSSTYYVENPSGFLTMIVTNESGSTSGSSAFTSHPYRCVLPLLH